MYLSSRRAMHVAARRAQSVDVDRFWPDINELVRLDINNVSLQSSYAHSH